MPALYGLIDDAWAYCMQGLQPRSITRIKTDDPAIYKMHQ